MIAIIDYGMGNIRSVAKACNYVGVDIKVSREIEDIKNASHIILPGVGAFKDSSELLFQTGLSEIIKDEVKKGKPLLGICLGMQLLAEIGREDGEHNGLGIIENSSVDMLPNKNEKGENIKIPHIGWNNVTVVDRESKLYERIEKESMFYFVHSYYINTEEKYILSKTEYGISFASSVRKDNVYGVQFHPEKSGVSGLRLIKNFSKIK